MDALDEFFAVWTEPEAWCEICGEFPAVHVVLRDTGGKFGGVMSHVRIWDPGSQTRVPACRHCCQHQMAPNGASQTASQQWPSRSIAPRPFLGFFLWWLRRRAQRLLRHWQWRLRQWRQSP